MTCIVGLVDEGKVYLGGDSAATSGWDMRILRSPKVFRVGPLIIGGTGEMRTLQALKHYLTVPDQPRPPKTKSDEDLGQSIEEWVERSLIDAIRAACKSAGYAKKDNDQDTHYGAWLIGYAGHLFHVDSHFGVSETAHGYDAVGCGESFALGVLYATEKTAPQKRLTTALEAAAQFSAGVHAPFKLETLE